MERPTDRGRRPTVNRDEPCVLCGSTADVRVALVRWRDPAADVQPFASLPRCRDTGNCRRRVEFMGEQWPVDDPKRGHVA